MKRLGRTNVINTLIHRNGYHRYLEIGVGNNEHFDKVEVVHKDGVDPISKCKYKMTSNEFFKTIPPYQMYDIIFVDGLHERDQVLRDIINSLDHLLIGGTIIVHDCNPPEASVAGIVKPELGPWYGTGWQGFVYLRMKVETLFMCVVDIDCGCGIIKRGEQKLFPEMEKDKIDFKLLDENRKELLNLISVEEFFTSDV